MNSCDWVFSLKRPTGESMELRSTNNHTECLGTTDGSHVSETASLLEASSGWNFHGPYWSISSDYLLKITYRPAWQSLPEYTNISATRDYCRRACGTNKKYVDIISQVYTTNDIQRVQELDTLSIRGVGACRGIRLFLKRKKMETNSCILRVDHQALSKQWALPHHRSHNWDRIKEEPDSLEVTDHIGIVITFAMPIHVVAEHGAPVLWKIQLPACSRVALETITVLDGKLDASKHESSPTHVYINGYQSWSFSGSVAKGEPQPSTAMPNLASWAFNNGGSPPPTANINGINHCDSLNSVLGRKKDHGYQSEFFTCITSDGMTHGQNDTLLRNLPQKALDEMGGPALVAGWLSQHHHFGIVLVDHCLERVTMHASGDAQILKMSTQSDWAYLQLVSPTCYDEEPMVHFLHAVASHNVARPLQNGPILTGWCSWYHYYEKITAATLKENFKKLAVMKPKIPTNVAVVDDGYMTAWGDWDSLKPGKFPGDGLKAVASDIRNNGMKPGLWLAPFACDKGSKIAKQHPDWIIHNDEGRIANSGNCGKWFYGLDVTNPNVREYVYGCVRRAVFDWGFEVLKIDFMYSACLSGNGKYDLSMTRAEAMHLALQTVRAAAGPHVFLIGCGCPIGPGIGYVDGMRVSADTGPTWYPALPFPYWDNGTLPALRAMIRNSMSRAPLGHRWWHNDPDCLLLGETTRLTDIEVASAASIIAMTCGMLLLSDDLMKVSAGRMNIATKILPMTGATAVVLDLHSATDGLPSLLRLWCSDRYQPIDGTEESDHNRESTLLARYASFSPDGPAQAPSDRRRNCVRVAKGLGTWTLLSVSNWTDQITTVRIPAKALELLQSPSTGWNAGETIDSHDHGPISEHGFHIFSFWSSEYTWRPDPRENTQDHALSKTLAAHATEIFHFKRVNPTMPDYIGSNLHFSCGYEVKYFESTPTSMAIQMRKDCDRAGFVFLYIPSTKLDKLTVTVAGVEAQWKSVGNTPDAMKVAVCIGRVIRVPVLVKGDGSSKDGEIMAKF